MVRFINLGSYYIRMTKLGKGGYSAVLFQERIRGLDIVKDKIKLYKVALDILSFLETSVAFLYFSNQHISLRTSGRLLIASNSFLFCDVL